MFASTGLSLSQHFDHTLVEWSLLTVENELVSGLISGEDDSGGGLEVLWVEGEADGVVYWEDKLFVELAPVFYQSDVWGSHERGR